ncbi:MAG: helix-turn-helix transcriptional regulator [Bacteroidetes bacterium]|nr:helix-turn-helix transcriptional regulator [Bacteroidota bacterium]
MEFAELKPEEIERAANMLKTISHPIRLAVPGYLSEGSRLSVTKIHELLGIEQSTASHHLGILKDEGILASSRQTKNTLYYLKQENLSQLVHGISECAFTD